MKSPQAPATAIIVSLAAIACCASAIAQTAYTPRDKTFLAASVEGSTAEVALGKLAVQKSTDAEIKTFAQKMIDDHTMLLDKMKPFADQAGIPPLAELSPADKAALKQLSALTGDDFNRAYLKDMVADHHKDLGAFMAERDSTTNANLRTAVTASTQVVREHTEMIDMIAKDEGVPTPPMPALFDSSIPPRSDQGAAQVEPVTKH
jgi:putative membrane protein